MLGVYVHFPYCQSHCPFCDFAVAVAREIPHETYAEAVLAELDARAPGFAGRALTSIYFGGGTPGLWRADCVARVIAAITSRFGEPREVTVECIPRELSLAHAQALRAAGVTRLSIGIESLDDTHLRALGRNHSAQDAKDAVGFAQAAGFERLSADFMFALPGQSLAAWQSELARALALDLSHFSLYELTIEPGTAFGRKGVRTPEGADYFLAAHDRMTQAGFLHYEISSYARTGHLAIHNSLYWSGGEILGLGMSAHSFRRTADGGGERSANTRDLAAYLGRGTTSAGAETLSPTALRKEAAWLGLRRLDTGLVQKQFSSTYGADPAVLFAPALDRLVQEGLVETTQGGFRLTRRGMLLADEVALRFL